MSDEFTREPKIRPGDRELVEEYYAIRKKLYEAITYSLPTIVEGPARLIYIESTGPLCEFKSMLLHPGQRFEGQCIIYEKGIYD